jgi:hypothetical protein
MQELGTRERHMLRIGYKAGKPGDDGFVKRRERGGNEPILHAAS